MIWFLLIAAPVVLLGLVTIGAALLASRCDRLRPEPPPARQAQSIVRLRRPAPESRGY
jgi:hypothetical protein